MHPQVVQLPPQQSPFRSQIPLSILHHVILLRHLFNCVQLLSQAFFPTSMTQRSTEIFPSFSSQQLSTQPTVLSFLPSPRYPHFFSPHIHQPPTALGITLCNHAHQSVDPSGHDFPSTPPAVPPAPEAHSRSNGVFTPHHLLTMFVAQSSGGSIWRLSQVQIAILTACCKPPQRKGARDANSIRYKMESST